MLIGFVSVLKGGPLYDFYYLEEIHAHWGETGFAGSEHLLDGRSFAGELHFVHWNRKYVTFKEALTKPDGIAVIAVFLEVKSLPTPFLTRGRTPKPSHIQHRPWRP